MRLLLDTHIALWAVSEPTRLKQLAQEQIVNPDNDVLISLVSLWEIAIKRSTGRARIDVPSLSARDTMVAFSDADFEMLAIKADHIDAVEVLQRHHGDPFDRLLVAQAWTERLTFLTHDKTLGQYGDFVMVV